MKESFYPINMKKENLTTKTKWCSISQKQNAECKFFMCWRRNYYWDSKRIFNISTISENQISSTSCYFTKWSFYILYFVDKIRKIFSLQSQIKLITIKVKNSVPNWNLFFLLRSEIIVHIQKVWFIKYKKNWKKLYLKISCLRSYENISQIRKKPYKPSVFIGLCFIIFQYQVIFYSETFLLILIITKYKNKIYSILCILKFML